MMNSIIATATAAMTIPTICPSVSFLVDIGGGIVVGIVVIGTKGVTVTWNPADCRAVM